MPLTSRQLTHAFAAQAPVGRFSLRYFVCGLEQWQATPDGQPGPIFFYAGNVRLRP